MSIGIHQLRCFVAVAEHRHVSRAAKSLFMTQPAMSSQIRILEANIGYALFERHPRGVELTPAGEAFLTHARVCLAEYNNALEAARAAGRGAVSVVRVGIILGTQVDVISRVLRTFHSAVPRTRIEFVEHTFQDPSAGLTTSATDVAFVVLPMRTKGLSLFPLVRAGVVAALPGGHRLSSVESLSITDILSDPWVSADTTDEVCRDYWLASAHRHQPPIVHHRVRTMDKFVQLVAAGEAIGIAPSWIVPYYRGEAVRFVPVRDVEAPTIALAWRTEDTQRSFIIQMRAAARAAISEPD